MRATIFYNRRNVEENAEMKELLDKTDLDYRSLPHDGCYTLWLRDTKAPHFFQGPTAVKYALEKLTELAESDSLN